MHKIYIPRLRSKILATTLALCLSVTAFSPALSAAEVIDGEVPAKSVITLGEVFNDISQGNGMTNDDYRAFFHDLVDTTNVLKEEFALNKSQLKLVAKKLSEFEVETVENLTDFDTLKSELDERIKYYEMIKGAIEKSVDPVTSEDGSIIYTITKSVSGDYTQLTTQPDNSWELTEFKDGIQTSLAHITTDGYAAMKANNDVNDTAMIAGDENSVFIGQLDADFNYEGLGTEYNQNGSIDSGKWTNNKKDGFHYIYNTEEEFTVVIQFKDGKKHGMSSYQEFDSEDIYTYIYIDDEITGFSYSELNYESYTAEVMYIYEDEERLPLVYITYPNKDLTRLLIGSDEDQIEIYDTRAHDRFFISQFNEGKPTGFGYSIYGDIEYIGTFKGFDILADGAYYNITEEDAVFDAKVDGIIDDIIERDMTDRQKILAVHDYVVNNVRYHKPYAKVNEHPSITHTAYGAIMNGSAVCDGYAQSFKVFLDKLGFENQLIFGITIDADGEFQDYNRHAWNLVKYKDEYLHFDTTWNDPTYSDRVRHTYYFMDTEDIKEDHQWIEEDYSDLLTPTTQQQ